MGLVVPALSSAHGAILFILEDDERQLRQFLSHYDIGSAGGERQ